MSESGYPLCREVDIPLDAKGISLLAARRGALSSSPVVRSTTSGTTCVSPCPRRQACGAGRPCQARVEADVRHAGFLLLLLNEHEPIHVHVRSGSDKAKFDVSDEVQLLESKGMKVPELRKAQELAEENVEIIRSKWHEYFG